MNSHNTSDVVIVGGGIYGSSLAYELTKAGKSVTLLEAGEIACGASGGPGERGVRANGRDVRELPIVALAQERWLQYQQSIEGGVGYRRKGGMWIVSKGFGVREHEIMGAIEARAMIQTAMGSPTEFLSRSDALAREPELSSSIFGAVYSPNDGVGDHSFATRQFAKEAQKLGAKIRTGAKVVEIVHKNGDATGVKLEDGEVVPVTGQLALMANAGMLGFLKPLLGQEERMPIYNLMPQMMYVTNPDGRKLNHLLGHMQRPLAIKQLPDGTIMLSGGVSVAYDQDGGTSGTLSAMSINLSDAIQTMPFLERSAFIKTDATRTDTVSIDGIPIIGKPGALNNTIYGYAWTGHGYAISLGFTKYLTDWLLSGEKPAELEPFSPRRFIDPARQAIAAVTEQRSLAA
ncbi:FAD-dependent oxidoreductase [Aliihoeflea aestuarii]|jgi:sarcosine oxidase, subunit beta|uniref:NAD(P)/FAD-dependent oxidoreductase n=1 Tax=Aliihoeflea aestuarii TaxID=453840 RepID=UPI002091E944|nr:FAD-binding oxidoreductase [Aliihoeflea aestuarii]MCO6390081.1 FAD-dependent oxidoreductase [Aliihoeflea aestuarii]